MSEEKTIEIPEPTKEQAERNLEKVDYEDRIAGIKMHKMAGNQRHRLRSLKDVLTFIDIGSPEDLLQAGSAEVNYIDPDILVKWIRDVIKDGDLANAIEEDLDSRDNFKEKAEVIKELIDKRLYQSQKVIEEN